MALEKKNLPHSSPASERAHIWTGAFSHASAVGFAVCDDRLRFQMVNSALGEMNGVAAADHLGRSVHEVLGAASDRVEVNFRRVLKTGIGLPPTEWFGKLQGKSEPGWWIHAHLPVPDASGRVTRVAAIVIEVSRQRALEQWLREYHGSLVLSRAQHAHSLASQLRVAINGYHTALAQGLAHLSRGFEQESDKLASVVAVLDARLEKMRGLIAEVAARFPSGPHN